MRKLELVRIAVKAGWAAVHYRAHHPVDLVEAARAVVAARRPDRGPWGEQGEPVELGGLGPVRQR